VILLEHLKHSLTAASLQNLGTQTIKELARRWEVQIAKIGEVALQFIQNYTDEGELLEFVGHGEWPGQVSDG